MIAYTQSATTSINLTRTIKTQPIPYAPNAYFSQFYYSKIR